MRYVENFLNTLELRCYMHEEGTCLTDSIADMPKTIVQGIVEGM